MHVYIIIDYVLNVVLIEICMQVAVYSAKGISAAYIMRESTEEMKEGVRNGDYQLVYITPELLICNAGWRKMLMGDCYSERLMAFVVDEAHTVKKWYINILF